MKRIAMCLAAAVHCKSSDHRDIQPSAFQARAPGSVGCPSRSPQSFLIHLFRQEQSVVLKKLERWFQAQGQDNEADSVPSGRFLAHNP